MSKGHHLNFLPCTFQICLQPQDRVLTNSVCTAPFQIIMWELRPVMWSEFQQGVSSYLWAGGTFCIAVDGFCQVIILFATSHDIFSNDLIMLPQPGSDFPKELMIVPQCCVSNLVWQTSFQALLWRVLRVLFNCICDLNAVSVYFTCMHCCIESTKEKEKKQFLRVLGRPVNVQVSFGWFAVASLHNYY